MRLRLWISKMRTGKAMKRVGKDSEFAYSTDQSTRILRFGKLEAEGGFKDTNIVEKKRQKCSPPKVRLSFSKTCGIVVRTMCQCRREDIWWSNRCTIGIGYRIGNGIVKSPNYRHYIHKTKILILPPKVKNGDKSSEMPPPAWQNTWVSITEGIFSSKGEETLQDLTLKFLCLSLLSALVASLSSPHILLLIPSSDSVCFTLWSFYA